MLSYRKANADYWKSQQYALYSGPQEGKCPDNLMVPIYASVGEAQWELVNGMCALTANAGEVLTVKAIFELRIHEEIYLVAEIERDDGRLYYIDACELTAMG